MNQKDMNPEQEEIILIFDSLRNTPQAKMDIKKSCIEQNIEYCSDWISLIPLEQISKYLDICKKTLAKYRTTTKFSVGDKVYVLPDKISSFRDCIRATITEIDEKWGYHLRAFEQDLPGIFMFNIWDEDLLPRTDKSKKMLSEEYFQWK